MLEVEIEDHLGYEKNSLLGTTLETTEMAMEKRQRRTDEIEQKIMVNLPLDSIYPVIFFNGIVFNSRKDNQIINKCVYSVLGINMA